MRATVDASTGLVVIIRGAPAPASALPADKRLGHYEHVLIPKVCSDNIPLSEPHANRRSKSTTVNQHLCQTILDLIQAG